jgi:hypothetical protein
MAESGGAGEGVERVTEDRGGMLVSGQSDEPYADAEHQG